MLRGGVLDVLEVGNAHEMFVQDQDLAVLIPDEISFAEDDCELEIVRVGDVITICPVRKTGDQTSRRNDHDQ